MATIVDYQYIPEVSTLDALHNLASDTTNWYSQDLPWVNTFLINWANQITNIPEWEGWLWIAWWSTDVKWTAWVWSISWTSGNINLPDWNQISISSGSANVTANTYLYVDMQDWTVYSTNSWIDAVGENKIMICAAFPNSWKNVTFKAFGCADQSSLTTWADIAARTIVASNIASWEITANEIHSNTITASEIATGAITSSKIEAGAVTASKIDVSQLSAITANLWDVHVGTTSWSWSWIRIYPYDSSTGRIDFYYNWNQIWYMRWQYNSNVWWWTVTLDWTAIALAWDVYNFNNIFFGWKLRIPVWTNLYN